MQELDAYHLMMTELGRKLDKLGLEFSEEFRDEDIVFILYDSETDDIMEEFKTISELALFVGRM